MKGFRSLGLAPDFDKFILKSVKDMEKGIKELRIEFITPSTAVNYYCNSCGQNFLAPNAQGSYTCTSCMYTTSSPSGSSYCNRCARYHSCLQNQVAAPSHESTCTFLPELHEKISTAVEGIKGLVLADFKTSKEKAAEAVGKWEIFEYK